MFVSEESQSDSRRRLKPSRRLEPKPLLATSAFSATIPTATRVAQGRHSQTQTGHRMAVQSTNHLTGDPRGPTYGSESWGFRVPPSAPNVGRHDRKADVEPGSKTDGLSWFQKRCHGHASSSPGQQRGSGKDLARRRDDGECAGRQRPRRQPILARQELYVRW